jgi:hypothetical protein
MRLIRALARTRRGMMRNELLLSARERSGGATSRALNELEESAFIVRESCFGKNIRDSIYRLIDEYSLFYLTWVEKAGGQSEGYWQSQKSSRAWQAWAGFSFEGLCQKHIAQVKKKLGIAGVGTTHAGWIYRGDNEGAQIDLVIDRADNCINLCEMKFSSGDFVITKKYAEELRRKTDLFRQIAGAQKSLFLTMITSYGCKHNEYFEQIAANEISMNDLFER